MRELTGAIASGDAEAFARFYREWFDRAYGHAKRMTGRDEAFCLDVVQDAMMRVIKSMRVMETENDVSNWLRAVVTSCAYDRLRKEKRSRVREALAPSILHKDSDDLHQRLAWLQMEMTKIDGAAHPMIVLKFRFGWTLEKIGHALGLKAGAVDGRIRRATRELQQKWTESQDD
jgi:RNA polymerase sigma factor (sigma-70 family)